MAPSNKSAKQTVTKRPTAGEPADQGQRCRGRVMEQELAEELLHIQRDLLAHLDEAASSNARDALEGIARRIGDVESAVTLRETCARAKGEWERTFDAVPDLIAILNDRYQIVRANKAMADRLGLTPEQCAGLTCYTAIHGTDQPPSDCPHRQLLKDGQVHTVEVNEERLSGDFLVSTSPLHDDQGHLIGSVHVARDITARKSAETEQKAAVELLELINHAGSPRELMRLATRFFRDWLQCDAVGIRLRDGEDFPYFETRGFPEGFVLAENALCAVDPEGELVRDSSGNPVLECMCGNVICKRFDPAKPFFTRRGSFWTNGTSELLATTSDADRQARTRNRCNGEGYESVALIPLRMGSETYGLLQLNALRKGLFSPERIDVLETLADYLAVALSQQRTEAALCEKTILLDNLLRSASDVAIATTDLDFRITYYNPLAEELFGFTAAEVIGKTVMEVHTREKIAPERFEHAIKEVREQGEYRYSVVQETACGPRYLESRVTGIRDPEGNLVGFALFSREVTERKQAEEALRDGEQRFRLFASAVTDVIYRYDPCGRRYDFVSPSFETQTGYAIEELEARPVELITQITHPDDAARVVKEVEDFIGRGPTEESFRTEYRVRHKDGRWICVEDRKDIEWLPNGTVHRINGVVRDVTERKRAEETLAERERRFADIAENALEWIWEVDADGKYTYASPVVEKILGYRPEEVLGKRFYDLFHPEDRKAPKEAALGVFTQRQPLRQFVNRNVHKDGRIVWLSTSGVPMLDEKGNLLGYRGADTDITERKRAEEEKEILQAQLRQAQKMEAIGQLAGGIAHDFNNVLTAILGNVELMQAELRSELPADGTVMTGLQQIDRSGHRAAMLTRQLLAFSRRQVIRPEVLDPNRLLGEMESMLRRLLDERIAMELQLETGVKRIRADAGQIEQVLMNLLVNARDAMPDGGQLTIETANVVLGQSYCAEHPGAQPGPHVMLAVSDTGCGMDKRTRERIFEPFFTTKPLGQGTGLGLSTVYGIVKQSDGYVAASSEPGSGATFRVYLPAVDAPADEVVAHSDPRAEMYAGQETVLVCEDEQTVKDLACRILERGGYTALSAESGTRGLQVAEDHDGEIDMLVADVIMPDMNGVKLAEAMRETRPNIRVLYVSGYTPSTIAEDVTLDMDAAFLAKPFSVRTLLKRVRETLDGVKQPS